MDRSFPPSLLPPLRTQPFIVEALSYHLLPSSSPGENLRPPERCPHLPPVSLRRSSLYPALCVCICFCSQVGALPPLPPLAYTHAPISPCWFCPSLVPPRLCVPAFPSLSYHINLGIAWFLVSVLVGFLRKGDRRRRLHSLSFARPGPLPPLLGHADIVQSNRNPPSPLSSPPCSRGPIPVGRRSVVHSARSRCKGRVYQSW